MTLAKNFDAQSAEARILKEWLESNAFAAGANKSREDAFSIMIPPPNVTGALHMGHAFNNTLQDILVRWHRMRGFDTLWQPGQDHAGIATQMQVEKNLALTQQPSRKELGREAFLEKVWEWKEQYGGTIIEQLQRLGASCDWSRNAFTMDENFHDAVIKVFVDLYNKGLIYRGKRLVNWDPHFQTAISDLEVENIEVDGHFWHFKYPLANGRTYRYIEKDEDGKVVVDEERDYISIATTRPETMLGDGAVAVHPSDERYAPIVGALAEIPVGPKEHRRLVPIITDDYPDPNFGSGAVKITGAHDFNDYAVAKRNKIPLYNLMDTRAHMRADGLDYEASAIRAGEISRGADYTEAEIIDINLVPDDYRGLDRFDARKKIVAEIDAEGLMIKVEDKKIMQPFTDRSKVVMEPYLTDQWYVDAEKLAGPALNAVRDGTVQIIPEREKKVYYHWLENIEPWAISRQLWWGHQIPVWYDSLGGQYCASSVEEAQLLANEAADRGRSDGDVDRDPSGNVILTRDPDVLDTWFSSGLWPIGTLGWPNETPELQKYFPTSVLMTGFDILFFWVARMMMMQLEVVGREPFHTIYLHALVRDENGVKMSKTLGNVIDPLELIDEFGADAVRFTMTSMAAIGGTLKLSRERVTGYRNFGTKIWNIAKFAEFNEATTPDNFDPRSVKATLNRWIISEIAKTRLAVDDALLQYRFNDAANGLYAFAWNVMADWYVEFSKPLLNGEDEALKAETRATLAWALDQIVIMLHPIMPFITEELWSSTGDRDNMLVHQNWPIYGAELIDDDASTEMEWAINIIERIRSTRQELHVPAGAKVTLNQISLDKMQAGYFERNRTLIERLARIDKIEILSEAPKGAVSIPVDGGLFALPLAGLIDVNDEIARLQKSLDKLAKEQGGLKGRLNNPKFVDSAPADVVEASRSRMAELDEEMAKLGDAMKRMHALL